MFILVSGNLMEQIMPETISRPLKDKKGGCVYSAWIYNAVISSVNECILVILARHIVLILKSLLTFR